MPNRFFAAVVVAMVACVGCGQDGAQLAPVGGTILLDGEPLEGALVEFQPLSPTASPSYAATDKNGYYEMAFTQDRQGAMIGKHTVRISTRNENERIPEKLPPEYHAASEITREVVAGQANTFDFDIKTSGE